MKKSGETARTLLGCSRTSFRLAQSLSGGIKRNGAQSPKLRIPRSCAPAYSGSRQESWVPGPLHPPTTHGIFPAEQCALNSSVISAACEWWVSTETAFSLDQAPTCTGRLCLPSSGVRFPCYVGSFREFWQKSSESALLLQFYLQDIRGLAVNFPTASNRELNRRSREF